MSHHTPLAYQPCKVPLRRAINVFGNISMAVHEGIYEDVLEADRRWLALGGTDFFIVRQADTGSFSCRPSAGHSRAVAIDFNWQSNPMGPKKTPCPQQPQMRQFYEECFKPLGYGWGGNWNSKCDAMHISKLLSEGGNGVLYQTWEDDVSKQDVKDALKEMFNDADDQEVGAALRAGLERRGGKTLEATDIIEKIARAIAANPGKALTFDDAGNLLNE